MSERRGHIHEQHALSKTRRCERLDVARSSAYYRREPVGEADLVVMRLIDEIHLQWPFYGSRRMRDALEERGHTVNSTATIKMRVRVASFNNVPEFSNRCLTKMFLSRL